MRVFPFYYCFGLLQILCRTVRAANLANSHEGSHDEQEREPNSCSNWCQNCCNRPPSYSKTEYLLPANFISPYASNNLLREQRNLSRDNIYIYTQLLWNSGSGSSLCPMHMDEKGLNA